MTSDVLLRASKLRIQAEGGRTLFHDLSLSLEREAVALVGRNGVGKSTLLQVLAGELAPDEGHVECGVSRGFVPQRLLGGQSPGEVRRARLEEVRRDGPEVLLLDEPTRDLDAKATRWLRDWLASWTGALLVASHHSAILSLFEHFFVVEESGCRYFCGSFDELKADFDRRRRIEEQRYVTRLTQFETSERRNETILRRRRRKKNLGRLHELGRNPSRAQLGAKTAYAQESQGRAAKVRAQRTANERAKGEMLRRGLKVDLPLSLVLPSLPEDLCQTNIELKDVSHTRGTCLLFRNVNLTIRRERIAIVGPNGAGKTSLLELALSERKPTTGTVFTAHSRIGVIAQGAENWRRKESLLSVLLFQSGAQSAPEVADVLHAHHFPLGLAERPLASLSPGERVRAALIGLCQRQAPPELLVLDEPTSSLDFLAIQSLTRSLRAWRGGLLVVSHDEDFLEGMGVERWLRFANQGLVEG
ncbi:MAG: ATPase subunit of ABC transporter with duplicated ATPase domains [Polyangiales bacterium]|jgi:ATPase subunit of ABC transporter with duplicated ATPase domains